MKHISARRISEFLEETLADCHLLGMMTAARSPPPLELDAISERELDKLKQKVERLGKFLRIRILRGSPEEEVGAWSDYCLHHETVFHGQAALHHHRCTPGTGIPSRTWPLTRCKWAKHSSWSQQTVVSPLPLPRITTRKVKSRDRSDSIRGGSTPWE